MRAFFLAVLTAILAGCASRDLWPTERVDPDTAIHLTVMAEPWIYSLDDSRQAADASDFLDVTVVETNRTGNRSYWLNVVAWSTRTRGDDAGRHAGDGQFEVLLTWPAKQLQLVAAAGGRSIAGVSEPVIPVPRAQPREAWFPLSAAQVTEFNAGAPTAVTLIDDGGHSRSYVTWQVDDAAIAEFLEATIKSAY